MFAFGCAINDEDQYSRFARPGLRLAMEEDSRLFELRGVECIFRAYNDVLSQVRAEPDLEGVVLLHQDTEIADPEFLTRLRAYLAEPDVWVVGAIGGLGLRQAQWWESKVWLGSVRWDPYPDIEEPHPERFEMVDSSSAQSAPHGEVDILDGLLLALSAEAVRELSFDESLGPGFHGYDADICLQARERGKRVRAEALDLVHHTDGSLRDRREYARAHMAVSAKWRL